MLIKRSQVRAIRSAIHEVDRTIRDQSQLAEYERDLIAQACLSLYELDFRKVLSCLRRLCNSPVRKEKWIQVWMLTWKVIHEVGPESLIKM